MFLDLKTKYKLRELIAQTKNDIQGIDTYLEENKDEGWDFKTIKLNRRMMIHVQKTHIYCYNKDVPNMVKYYFKLKESVSLFWDHVEESMESGDFDEGIYLKQADWVKMYTSWLDTLKKVINEWN